MADGFTVRVVGDRQLIAKFVAMPESIHRRLVAKVWELALQTQSKVVRDHLSGPTGAHSLSVGANTPMHTGGQLRRSLQVSVKEQATAVIGKVFFSADVPYAAAHEFGATIHIPEIVPVNAKALYFMMGGQGVFAMRVKAHDVVLPERAPLRTGFAEMIPTIEQGLRDAVREGIGIKS